MNLPLLRMPPFFDGQMGVPGSEVPVGLRYATGNVYFVGKSSAKVEATDDNSGVDPLKPKATIQAALDQCVADHGDIVVILPGTYTLTAPLNIAVDGVKLVGWELLFGAKHSSVIVTGAAALNPLVTVDADNIEIGGIVFGAPGTYPALGEGSIECACLADHVGLYIHDCAFYNRALLLGGGDDDFTLTYGTIMENQFIYEAGSNGGNGIVMDFASYCNIANNIFKLNVQLASGIYAGGAILAGNLVAYNLFMMVNAAQIGIVREDATTIMIAGNMFTGVTVPISVKADGGLYVVQNYKTSAAGGVLIDATT